MSDVSFTVRPYSHDDAAAVAGLRQATYGDEAVSEEVFRWRHFGLRAPNGMQVAVANGRVVGIQPVELYAYARRGERLTGAVLTGVMVHPHYRRRGIFTALVEACEAWAWKQGADFITTMPNHRSLPGFLKRGYSNPGQRRLMVRPLALGTAAARRWRAPWMAPPFNWASRQVGSVVPRLTRPIGSLDIRDVQRFSDDLGPAMEQECLRNPRLVQVRSMPWLRWRYELAPQSPYALVEARRGGAPVGYAVVRQEMRMGMQVGYLVDIMGQQPRHVIHLVQHAAEKLRRDGCEVAIGVVSGRGLIGTLAAAGFVPVPHRASPKKFHTVYRGRAHPLAGLDRIDAWYQTLGDWDNL